MRMCVAEEGERNHMCVCVLVDFMHENVYVPITITLFLSWSFVPAIYTCWNASFKIINCIQRFFLFIHSFYTQDRISSVDLNANSVRVKCLSKMRIRKKETNFDWAYGSSLPTSIRITSLTLSLFRFFALSSCIPFFNAIFTRFFVAFKPSD